MKPVPQKVFPEVWQRGLAETREAWRAWEREGFRVLLGWFGLSLLVASGMLVAVVIVAELLIEATRAAGEVAVPGFLQRSPAETMASVLGANGLVLALHALVCWAAYLARRAVPDLAPRLTGVNRWVHERAGPWAMVIVTLLVAYSIGQQVWTLGEGLAQIAVGAGLAPLVLMARLAPHALVELTAVFLPLAAFVMLGRRGQWNPLLAAAGLSSLAALPLLLIASLWEGWVAPIFWR